MAIPAAIGLVGGLLNKPPKMPENPFLNELKWMISKGKGLYDGTNWSTMVDQYEASIAPYVDKALSRVDKNANATLYAAGGDPTLFNTSNDVKKGAAMRGILEDAALKVADMRYNIPNQQMGMLGNLASMSNAGAGIQANSNAQSFSAALDNWKNTSAGIGALAGADWGGKGTPKTTPGKKKP